MTRRRFSVLVFGMIVSLSGVASATTMRALSVVDLTDQADLIVRGRVVGTSDVMTEIDGRLVPRLVARIEPLDVLAGDAPAGIVTVVEPGGRNRSMIFLHEGFAEFRRGQEVLLFLARTDEGYRPVGHAQGAFVVGRDRRSDAARLRRAGEPGVLIGSAIEKGMDLSANPRLEAVETVVHERRGAAR